MQFLRYVKMDGQGNFVGPFYPHKHRGHIDVYTGRIYTKIGSVGIVAIDGIHKTYITGMAGNFIHIPVDAVHHKWRVFFVKRLYVVHVLAKLMRSISPWR